MGALAAVIFDVDGTLAETEELHRLAFNEAFAAAGLDWVWDEPLYARLLAVTGGKERIAAYIASDAPQAGLGSADIARLHADKTRRYTARVAAGGMALRPGVARLVGELEAAGIGLAIATTTSRPNVDALLAATWGRNPFAVIACGDEVARKKPAPDIYRLALARLGLPAAACLAVEDTLNGLHSAADAGLRCLITTSLYGGAGPFPGACAVISHLGEPNLPARALAGGALAGPMVDAAQLQAWASAASGPAAAPRAALA